MFPNRSLSLYSVFSQYRTFKGHVLSTQKKDLVFKIEIGIIDMLLIGEITKSILSDYIVVCGLNLVEPVSAQRHRF